jgi:hypothetical protein
MRDRKLGISIAPIFMVGSVQYCGAVIAANYGVDPIL